MPTFPLPALTRSDSFGMYEKLASNELMLKSDGTVAEVVPPPPPLLPPHAATRSPTTAMAGNNLANFMRLTSQIQVPVAFFPAGRGESAPAYGVYSGGASFRIRKAARPLRALLTPEGLSRDRNSGFGPLFELLTNPRART